ncbi:MAG: tyrosine-type recombinase/integrase [Actinomycetales bacterium]|nr:tyrosine-type recombinase/integrase [Actinomycetales bacterium]
MDPRSILCAVSRSATRVGIDHPVGVHSLRHSAATAMLEAGINLKAVSDLLGHTDSPSADGPDGALGHGLG